MKKLNFCGSFFPCRFFPSLFGAWWSTFYWKHTIFNVTAWCMMKNILLKAHSIEYHCLVYDEVNLYLNHIKYMHISNKFWFTLFVFILKIVDKIKKLNNHLNTKEVKKMHLIWIWIWISILIRISFTTFHWFFNYCN